MRRYFIMLGDRTTAGGIVMQGETASIANGQPFAYQDAKINCQSCMSEGHIHNVGPSRTMMLLGKQIALENDLCICKCNPPPKLIASQDFAFLDFESSELDMMGFTSGGKYIGDTLYDQHFLLKDAHTGAPLPDTPYRIVTDEGDEIVDRTDMHGYTQKVYAKSAVEVTIQIFDEHEPLNPDWDRLL
jgi:uncharacterized Zn-binding protein involved in type VI secretion